MNVIVIFAIFITVLYYKITAPWESNIKLTS